MLDTGRASRAGNKTYLEAQALLLAMRGKSPDHNSASSTEAEDQPRRVRSAQLDIIFRLESNNFNVQMSARTTHSEFMT